MFKYLERYGLTRDSHADAGSQSVLFLHGFMGRRSDWDCVVEHLGPAFNCIVIDLPDHGARVGADEYSIADVAREIMALLDEQRIAKCGVAGYSMGGRIALYLAVHYPGRFSAVALESASPGLETETERRSRRAADETLAARLETMNAVEFGGFLRDWYQLPLFADIANDKAKLTAMLRARSQNDPRLLARSLRMLGAGAQPSLWAQLEQCRVPVLNIVGACDEKFVEIAREMSARCTSMETKVVPDGGHNVHFMHPKTYAIALNDFFSQHLPTS